jgi:hypothetical protein
MKDQSTLPQSKSTQTQTNRQGELIEKKKEQRWRASIFNGLVLNPLR